MPELVGDFLELLISLDMFRPLERPELLGWLFKWQLLLKMA